MRRNYSQRPLRNNFFNSPAVAQQLSQQYPDTVPARPMNWLIAVAFIVAGIAVSAIHLIFQSSFITLWQLVAFLLLGLGMAVIRSTAPGAKQRLSFALAILVAVVLFAGWAMVLKLSHHLPWSRLFVWLAAFLFPVMVMEAWRQFQAVTVKNQPRWFYSRDIPETPPFAYLENCPLRLRVVNGNGVEEEFKTEAPLSMPLGQAFFYAVKEGRTQPEWEQYFLLPDGRAAAWAFFTPGLLYGKSYLYPHETLKENQLKPSALVVAQRLQTPDATQS